MRKSTLENSEHKPGAPLIGKVCGNTRRCLVAIVGVNGVLSKYMSISISECNLLRIRAFVGVMKVKILT